MFVLLLTPILVSDTPAYHHTPCLRFAFRSMHVMLGSGLNGPHWLVSCIFPFSGNIVRASTCSRLAVAPSSLHWTACKCRCTTMLGATCHSLHCQLSSASAEETCGDPSPTVLDETEVPLDAEVEARHLSEELLSSMELACKNFNGRCCEPLPPPSPECSWALKSSEGSLFQWLQCLPLVPRWICWQDFGIRCFHIADSNSRQRHSSSAVSTLLPV